MLLPQIIGVAASVVGDMSSRPCWGLYELDFVFSTLVVSVALTCLLPCCSQQPCQLCRDMLAQIPLHLTRPCLSRHFACSVELLSTSSVAEQLINNL